MEWLSEENVTAVVDWAVRLVEIAGALIIFVGAVIARRFVLVAIRSRNPEAFVPVRLDLGRYLALGLEFQLAGDILRTAIAPTFYQIGELAAVAAIRTALNRFLGREIREEKAELARNESGSDEPPDQRASTGRLR